MTKITYQAPAKVILTGEHAVVAGKPALITAINCYLRFSIFPALTKTKDSHLLLLEKIVSNYLKQNKYPFKMRNYAFSIESEIPSGRGLGSSAAFSTASVAALLEFFTQKTFSKKIINELAYQMEKYFHHNPSGADNSTVCYGGLIFYRKEFEFLKNICRLDFIIPNKIARTLFLVDTGKPKETTAQMVKQVKKKQKIFNQIEEVTKKIVEIIRQQDLLSFQQEIRNNEILLEKIGAVSEPVKFHLRSIADFAAAKITGAGGRKAGSGYLLVSTLSPQKLMLYCQDKHLPVIKLTPTQLGVTKV